LDSKFSVLSSLVHFSAGLLLNSAARTGTGISVFLFFVLFFLGANFCILALKKQSAQELCL
jgi:ABC-type transport system involved in multi-copper enzyme maturation permease subunit